MMKQMMTWGAALMILGASQACGDDSPSADCRQYCIAANTCTGGSLEGCDIAGLCQFSDALVDGNGCDRAGFYGCLIDGIQGSCATWKDCNGRYNTEKSCHETHCQGNYPTPNICK